MGLFSSAPNSYLGIDIGTSSIKVVELAKEKGQAKLLTYGFSEYSGEGQDDWQNNTDFIAKSINKICKKASTNSKNAVSALPTFSVFSSILNLSNISKKDIASAVHWEAKKVVPLPLEEMILDWRKVEDYKSESKNGKNNIRVLLTGAPRSLVKKYIETFKKAQINLLSLETETFSLVRSLLGNDKSTIMLVEIGANTTDVSIVDNSIPILNRSIDVGGGTITQAISDQLKIGADRAEQFKYDLGISSMDSKEDVIPKIIIESISPIVNEAKYAANLFQSKNVKKIEKIVLSGGSAFIPNLTNYLTKALDMKVIIGNPWNRISYPVDLEPLLNEIGPRMSVAIGLALREIE